MKVRDEAAQHPNFEFAVMEDKENYKYVADPEARAQKIVADVGYINSTYFSSPAYMRRNGRPVLFVFQDETPVNWKLVRDGVRALGNPLLIFRNDFNHDEADGAFAWIDVCTDPISSLNDFYARAKDHPGSLVWGAAFPGFDDHLAAWGTKRIVYRRAGQLWLDSFASARNNYSSSSELSNIQLVTWNDYDEGTEIESGIDNGTSISGTIDGTVLNWTISGGTEGTIHSFRVFTSRYPDRERLTLRGEVPAGGVHSFDLGSLPSGDYEVFVQAQGQPGFRNHTTDAGRFTRAANPRSRRRAVRSRLCVSISSPANCAAVSSPIHVLACEKTSASATAMQIYLDGKLYVDRLNVDCLDEQVTAGAGAHQIEVKAWYADGSNCLVTMNVIVIGAPVTISSPANDATVTSPIHVIADENTPAIATSMQIYLDGTLKVDRPNVDHLDKQVTADPGGHEIAVKAWYADGSNKEAIVSITVASAPVTISLPANGATVTSPIHVVADENTQAPATSMQIYLERSMPTSRTCRRLLMMMSGTEAGYESFRSLPGRSCSGKPCVLPREQQPHPLLVDQSAFPQKRQNVVPKHFLRLGRKMLPGHPTGSSRNGTGRSRWLSPQRSDVQDDGIDVPVVDGMSPRRHEAGQPDPCAAAADGIGEIDVRLALLKGRFCKWRNTHPGFNRARVSPSGGPR